MPNQRGRFTTKEKLFVKAMARTNDATYAATKAGYSSPAVAGWRLENNPIVMEATREDARTFLRDKAGAISVFTLASIAVDDKQPAGARVNASKILGDMSGIAVTDADTMKELHEMTPTEMSAYRAKLQRQSHAISIAMSDQAKVIEHEQDSVFG